MTINMNAKKNTSAKPGIALLVVLIIVMAIAITALGFLSQSDVELACGRNMLTRTQMDYLAESGLEHAKGLILNPQDVSSAYWTGGTGLQLVSGSNDCYDVKVVQNATDRCNYTIDCNSYRISGTERIGLSRLRAVLRLDPCIAYWAGTNTTVWPQMNIKGDVYCGGNLTNNNGVINGDAYAVGTISGTVTGRKNQSVASPPVAWPNLAVADYAPTYYIGATSYSALQLADANIPSPITLNGVYCRAGDANMPGNITINGTLIVTGNLTVSGLNNVITAGKNFPALIVTGQVVMKNGSSLVINGLAQVGQTISLYAGATSASVQVTGGVFIAGGGVTSSAITVNVTAAPEIASIEVSPAGVPRRWEPAANAFFKSIERIR